MGIVVERLQQRSQSLYIVRPGTDAVAGLPELIEYVEAEREKIGEMLLEAGGVLFRGFAVYERENFMQVKDLLANRPNFNYVDGNSPRTKLPGNLYSSTEYPKEYRISLHNELSYTNSWPGLIFFYCHIPAEKGGETPVVDCRAVLREIDADMLDRFAQYGVKYTRFLSGRKGVGKSWMDTFETTDRSVVEAYCESNDIEFRWEGDFLFLSQIGKGVAEHPATGEKVWFNQANQFHPSSLPDDIYRMLKIMHAADRRRYPQYASFGNGDEIPEDFLKQVTELQFEHAFKFPWDRGDVLMLDNMLMAHGRMPFAGERKIYVSMC